MDIRYFLLTIAIFVIMYFLMLSGVNRIYNRDNDIYHHINVARKLGVGTQTFHDNFRFWDWIVVIVCSIALTKV